MILEEAKFGNIGNFQKKILNRQTFSESMLCFFSSQLLKSLLYCHNCKVAHLDLKKQNIVVDEFMNFKLIDFSISFNYQNKGPDDIIELPFRGTNFYMPLEVLESRKIKVKELNKVDLYSFGVILYNFAFGSYPFGLIYGDENDYDLIKTKIKGQKLILRNDLGFSSYFLDFLGKLLEKDIAKRIGLNESLNNYWIKGADLLMEEKEKCNNISIFASYLLTNHIKSFNEYLGN